MDEKKFDLCVVGNGPAGMTAAIYAARYGLNTIVVGEMPGGLMTSAHKICNYPGFAEISGMGLTDNMQNHLKSLGVPSKMGRVNSISQAPDGAYEVKLVSGARISAKTVLIATGTKHRHLGLPDEDRLTGKGISYCATCDGMFYKGKTVAVIGGSDAANTSSLFLAGIAEKVYQIHRGDELRGEVTWIEQIKKNPKIEVIFGTQVSGLVGDNKLKAIKLNKPLNGIDTLSVDGIFVEIGSDPDTTLANELGLALDAGNYIVTGSNQSTSREGVWAAGDITTGSGGFRQIITACSEGAIAAESIFKYIHRN